MKVYGRFSAMLTIHIKKTLKNGSLMVNGATCPLECVAVQLWSASGGDAKGDRRQ
jgi:hypothetical protein